MDMNKAMELATKCAGQYQEMIRNMYPGLLEAFASVLVKETETAEKTCSSWQDTAKQYDNNANYYRELLYSIGKTLGKESYISDDGSRQEDVLCAKVPELVAKMKVQLRIAEDKADLWDRLIDKGINALDADTRTKVLRVMERLCVEKDREEAGVNRIGEPWSPETQKLFAAVEKVETPTPKKANLSWLNEFVGCGLIAPPDGVLAESDLPVCVAIEKHRLESTRPSVQNIPKNAALSWLNETTGSGRHNPPRESEQNVPRDLLTGASVAFSSGEYVSAGGEVRWDTKPLDINTSEPQLSKQETWRDRPSLL